MAGAKLAVANFSHYASGFAGAYLETSARMFSARNVLVIVSLALSVFIGLVIARGKGDASDDASGSGANNGAKRVVVGVSMDSMKEARWKVDHDTMMNRGRELNADV